MTAIDLNTVIRNIPDFPIPGIQFKDITTLLRDGAAFQQTIDQLVEQYQSTPIDLVVGVELRGLIFSAPVAYRLGAGLVPVRKPGKLPAATIQAEYTLEYGTNTLHMHADAIEPGMRVLIVDDLLATGGTIGATIKLVEQLGGQIVGLAFVIELLFLNGRQQLGDYPIFSLLQYADPA